MTLHRLIRKAAWAWQDWHFDRRMKRENPEWYAAKKERDRERKKHGRVANFQRRTESACHNKLRSELHHG